MVPDKKYPLMKIGGYLKRGSIAQNARYLYKFSRVARMAQLMQTRRFLTRTAFSKH